MYASFGKRFFDILLACFSLILFGPLMLIIACLIWIGDRGPAIFKQKRVGQNGKEFVVMKFRSMPINTGDIPSADATKVKVTKVGKFIRRTNIDELPQLFNILLGDMSIVGFRPALARQEALFQMREANGAHRALPGLTGLAQINSYDGMPEEKKAEWDGKYAERITFGKDLSIIARTFLYLLKPPPAY